MRGSIPKRYLIITFALYICTFIFFLIFNIIQFSPKTVDLYFKTAWVLNNSLLQFFENLIPVQSLAVILTFSVFYPEKKSGFGEISSALFTRLVTSVIAITLCLAALFFVGNELFKPGFYSRLDSFEYQTKASRTYLTQAEEAAGNGNYLESQRLLERYLAIKPDDPTGLERYRNASQRITNQGSVAESENEAGRRPQQASNLTYDDALRLARNYLEIEDYYSAYYYAQMAASLSGSSEDARSITSKAWAALLKSEPSKEDSQEFNLYARKKHGTELLLGSKPIDAYYLFNQLKIDYPEDPDVGKYLAESISATRKLTYFIDEAEKITSFPGTTGICALNINEADHKELLFIGKMVSLAEGTFFQNIEVIDFSPYTGVNMQMTSRFGKLIGDHIVLNGIDRENQSIRIYPEYQSSDAIPDIYNTLKLNVDPNFLKGLSSQNNFYKKLNILELIEFEPVMSGYGWAAKPLYIEIIFRILKPFTFIILTFLILAFSWKYRRFSGKLPVSGLVLFPVVIYITALFSEAYGYAAQLLCSFIVLNYGKTTALGLLLASQSILLFITLFLISSMNLKRPGEIENAEN
ncbi:MAG: hypothetical protein JEZ04_10975 [Spirochaetales bacterium]|nr:hypothetical protein [Spirochaetales bacterium]